VPQTWVSGPQIERFCRTDCKGTGHSIMTFRPSESRFQGGGRSVSLPGEKTRLLSVPGQTIPTILGSNRRNRLTWHGHGIIDYNLRGGSP